MSKLDHTTLRECLNYDPDTGGFTRRVSISSKAQAGTTPGALRPDGYIAIGINYRTYLAHRLAWLYYYGVWPEHHIDHINGVKTDNRIANLRDVPQQFNVQNLKRPHGKNPYLGTCFDKNRNKWMACIQANGKRVNLGRFATPEEARDAYLEAKRKLHAGCTI